VEDAIRRGFLDLDLEMMCDEQTKEEMSGTTAVVVLIRDQRIYCGNVGDSRAVASVAGVAEPLSYDHKPANEIEARRYALPGLMVVGVLFFCPSNQWGT
jgi:protein phosphatase 2C family protein 2/3